MVGPIQKIFICDQLLQFDTAPAILWVERKTLLIADLHLGKETSFQAASFPVPSGATERTLNKLRSVIDRLKPREVIVLGDFVHARCSLSASTSTILDQFWSDYSTTQFTLIEGNHDGGSRAKLSDWPIQVIRPPYWMAPFWLVHNCESEWPLANAIHQDAHVPCFAIGGHTHPAIRIDRSGAKVPCFVQTDHHLTIPAFGELTGNKCVRQQSQVQIYIAAKEAVYLLP